MIFGGGPRYVQVGTAYYLEKKRPKHEALPISRQFSTSRHHAHRTPASFDREQRPILLLHINITVNHINHY